MRHVPREWLSVLIVLIGVALLGFMVIEPFLNLPPVVDELTIGLALTSFSVFMMLAMAVVNHLSWPRRWRMNRSLPPRLRPFARLAAMMFDVGKDR